MKSISKDAVINEIIKIDNKVASQKGEIERNGRKIKNMILTEIKHVNSSNISPDNENMVRIAKNQNVIVEEVEQDIAENRKKQADYKKQIKNCTNSIMLSINRLKKETEEF